MTRHAVLLLVAVLATSGCTVNEVITAEETELVVATTPVEEALLLDVGIVEFSTGIADDNDAAKTGIFPEIRGAESRYIPYHLKQTLQGTGHWGAVRVIPSDAAFTDITVSGEILESNGEYIKVDVTVSDAQGRAWFQRRYETQTGVSSYSPNRNRREDPYQKVYNDIANDMYAHVQTLEAKDIQRVRQVSELKFFSDMSPLAYGEHLGQSEDGLLTPVRLPADNDPTVDRLRQIRERDRLVVDTLNEHYANFYYGIAIPYHDWRKVAREEAINYRQVRRSATMQTLIGVAVLAGSAAIDTDSSSRSTRNMKRGIQNIGISQGFESIFAGFTRRSEAKIHIEAIRELSESFGSEAAPMVIEVEGESRRLTGTAASQYEDWRRLLKNIYEAETGFQDSVEVGSPARSSESTG
ncbi:MAG: hypothetical protein AAF917_08845 [Pseudomonadota bacterium]